MYRTSKSATIGWSIDFGRRLKTAVNAPEPMLSVGFMLMPQFTLTPFAAMIDVLRLAADVDDFSRPVSCRWDVVAATDQPIAASCRFAISPTAKTSDAPRYDYIAVMGGLLHDSPNLSPAEQAFLRARAEDGTPLIGVCTGSLELFKIGLMENRKCCVSWFHVADLLERFPTAIPVADKLYVDDGDRITCAGGAGAADLAAHLVERHCSLQKAQKALRILQVDHTLAEEALQPSPGLAPAVKNDRVRRALLMMEQHLASPLSIADIAQRLRVSPRQLHRDFQSELGCSPAEAKIDLQLEYARMRLIASDANITQIAHISGFADSAHFARRFRRKYAQKPSEYRMNLQRKNPAYGGETPSR